MLAPHEFLLLQALHALPPERQEALARSCIELLAITAHYEHCPGIGVDGFPCVNPQDTCETCHDLVSAFVALGAEPESFGPRYRAFVKPYQSS